MSARLIDRGRYNRRESKAEARRELAELSLEPIHYNRFRDELGMLKVSNFGKRSVQDESTELYRIHEEMKGTLLASDGWTLGILIDLLNTDAPESAIEDARRQVIASLLGDFIENKAIQKTLRAAHIRRNFQFTFTLNVNDGRLHVIKLSDILCEFLRKTDRISSYAYQALDSFLAKLTDEERAKIDRGTVQYLDHGGKRYAYRVQFEGRNAVLLIAMDERTDVGFRMLVEKEAELYETAARLKLEIVVVPEVFAILGKDFSTGMVMTDCTKGGNASLVCVQGRTQLVPDSISDVYERDMRIIENAIPAFEFYGAGSVYVQKSKKTGEVRIVLLDMENCIGSIV